MGNFLKLMIVVVQIVVGSKAFAQGPCDNPKPIFGKILAICGDQMITHIGDQKLQVLGLNSSQPELELAYCETGGGRKTLHLQTNSEGYQLISEIYDHQKHQEQYQISNMWGEFRMQGTDYYGKPVDTKCVEYKDSRTNIEYIYN